MPKRRFGQRSFETSNEDKVLFPDAGITKGDLIDYYVEVSDVILRHVRDRPITMHRFPDGIDDKDFYQKQTPDYFPDWIDRVRVKLAEGGSQKQVLCQNQAALAYLANQACITPHTWLSRQDKLDHPDQMIFDLDPPGDDFQIVRKAAFWFRELLDDLGLPAYVKTTGSKGLHVLVPLDRKAEFDQVRQFARDVTKVLASRHEDDVTTEQRKDKRRGRLYLDVARNAYAQTAVPAYAVRAREGAPVATPVEWDELNDKSLGPQTYNMSNIHKRLSQKDDPWKQLKQKGRSLTGPRKKLDDVLSESS